jgi:hypothetical protein
MLCISDADADVQEFIGDLVNRVDLHLRKLNLNQINDFLRIELKIKWKVTRLSTIGKRDMSAKWKKTKN